MKKVFVIIVILVSSLTFARVAYGSTGSLQIQSFKISGDSAYDEYLSIANKSNVTLDLAGYTISRKSKSATSWNTLYKFVNFSISPQQVIVIAHPKYNGVADFRYSTTSYSMTTDNALAIISADKTVLDLVGYGDSISYEGAPLPNPEPGEIYIRTQDTNYNSLDFVCDKVPVGLDPNANKLVITEVMPAPNDQEEWFELFNPTSLPVSLSGLKICDAIGSVHCYYFGKVEKLEPLEYKIYAQSITKITLNNTGDWLEIRDTEDNLLVDSGGDYGDADSGISLSLFGSEYTWTKTATPNQSNIFTDTVEVETAAKVSPKLTASRVKKKVAKSVPVSSPGLISDTPSVDSLTESITEVKGSSKSPEKSNPLLGYGLIFLAVILFLGYNLWERREYARNIYHKIISRND